MNPDIEKYIKAFKTKFEFIGHKGVQCDEITVQNLEAFLTNALQSISEKTKQETIEKAFDWIWAGWNLDLANKDRAKKHFLSIIKGEMK